MARVDYYGILTALQTLLVADATLAGVTIVVEEEMTQAIEEAMAGWVGIFLERRDAPPNLQRLAAGTRTTYRTRIALWCAVYREASPDALQARDDLMGKVEIVLQKNPTISGTVSTSWLEGGEMPSARSEQGVLSSGEIVVTAEVTSST